MMQRFLPFCLILIATLTTIADEKSDEATTEYSTQQLEFFEKKIRPVLIEHCYECHSVKSEKVRGELLLDSRWGWQQGGESGEIIVPGHPNDSTILDALRYESFEMPPAGKLAPEIIADFSKWIEMGAADPREKKSRDAQAVETFNLEERKSWWSLQPITDPAVPQVSNGDWARNDYDRFVLAKLEEKGWQPSEPASKNSWLRRVTYDLTGLPPTPAEVKEFTDDESANAYEKVVDRLLASDHFGERWARHWMDLVRYAETKAFEADYPMPNVYQYRDYLIRAFNSDVSYDQLLREAIAGDLIPPRLNEESGINESVIGPGYLYLTDGQHGPPDVHLDEARIFDDMIDVLGKAFLSQTIACARCHDHKFDAITTQDYYSLYGIIASSRIDYADINPPKKQAELRQQLKDSKRTIQTALADILIEDVASIQTDLKSVRDGKADTPQQQRWKQALEKPSNAATRSLAKVLKAEENQLKSEWKRLQKQSDERATSLGSLNRDSFGDWIASGPSFESAPRPAGDFVVRFEGDDAVATFVGGRAAAGHLTSRTSGALRSPTFNIAGNNVRVRVKGKNVRVSLYVRHYELIGRGPTTGGTTKVINNDTWQTVDFGTRLWVGEPAYIEIQHNGGEMKFDWATGGHTSGAYAVIDTAANNRKLPDLASAKSIWNLSEKPPADSDALIGQVADRIVSTAKAWKDDSLTANQDELLQCLFDSKVLDFNINRSDALKEAINDYREMQRNMPTPTYVRTMADGPGMDEPVYIRGSHKNISKEPNPRHFLHGIDATPFETTGSGRLDWAESLVSQDNPLTTRVIVNRIWHYLFGRGIVASVDDFGHMGDKPTHPELLDFMANRFVDDGWSMKKMIRDLVLSSTYRMSSRASAASQEEDPNNTLLQHMPLRRLQAEAVRDTLLAVSGQLDKKLYGPSQKGDGGRRRSVYIQLRRRYMPEFLMTFDMPNSTETFGRRNVTAGPAQSLALMNGEISWRAADAWAKRISRQKDVSLDDRIDQMHLQAYGRHASPAENQWAKDVLIELGSDAKNVSIEHWKQLCHIMLNRKELIYLY